jgi:hypothetical protein
VNKIIEIAKQAGLIKRHDCDEWICNTNNLEIFDKLIIEKEREKILAVLRRKPDQQIYKILDEIRSMK